MRRIFLVLFIILNISIQLNAVEVKLDSTVVYLTSPEFSLPVRITPVNNVYGAAFDILYDTNILEICGVEEGSVFNKEGLDSTYLRTGLEDGNAGRFVSGIVRDDTAGINNTLQGVILNVKFRAKNTGVTEVNFDSSKSELKDPYNSTISAVWTKNIITIYASPADIEIQPSVLSLTINQGNDTTQALTIKNNGGEPLQFNITDNADWLALDTTSGVIFTGDSTLIILSFTSSFLSSGLYPAQIEVSSNDPYNSLAVLPVNLIIDNAPEANFSIIPYQLNTGYGKVEVNAAVNDINGDVNRLKIEYSRDGLSWNKAELEQVGASYETPVLNNQNEYQISEIRTASGVNNITFYWLSANDLPGIEDKTVYLKILPNDGWINGNINVSSVFEIDNLAPQGLGNLSFLNKSISSAGLAFGPASADPNFKEYCIYYDTAAITNGSRIWDKQKDANLGFQDYNGASSLVITGLQDSTKYSFNIQAIDTFGNRSTGAAINITTGQKRPVSENMENILQAIQIAQDGDEIEVAPGIYYGNILISGKNIDLTGKNPLLTFLDGRNNGSVISLENTSYGSINNFTILNGSGHLMEDSTNYAGGGIWCRNSALRIFRNIITGNQAGYGGGIYTQNSNAGIFNNTIFSNQAFEGVGIHASGFKLPDITNCIIWENGDNISGCSAVFSDIKDGDPGEGNISQEPLFKNKNTFNLTLNSNSPCIDAGKNIGLDFCGSLPDLGAAEYSSTALAPVTNFNVQDTPDDSGGSTDLSWTKSADDGINSNLVQEYIILRSVNNIDYNVLKFLQNGTEVYKDTTALAGTDYYYMVRTSGSEMIMDSEIIGPVQSRDNIPPVTTANPSGGVYNTAQTVTLSTNETATIYYTYDGTEPTITSNIYYAPINIVTVTTLKYFARDLAGNNETTKTEVYTINRLPIANAGLDQIIPLVRTAYFDGSGSVDPDGSIVSYNWDFGDEYSSTGITVSHKYETTGNYMVTLTVIDNSGASAETSINVEVFSEIIVDNTDIDYTSAIGTWNLGTSVSGYYGTNYQTSAAGTGNYKFNWMPAIPTSGTYKVYARWTADSSRADNAKYMVTNQTGSMLHVEVNQKLNNGAWVCLGKYSFIAGGTAQVSLSDNANGYVVADAVKFVYMDEHIDKIVDNTDTAYTSAVGTWSFSTSGSGYYGINYQSRSAGTGTYKFNWMPAITVSGTYEVYARWTASSNRADNAKYIVTNRTGSTLPVEVNQKLDNGIWAGLGKYSFTTGDTAMITLNNNANGYVIADAVKILHINDHVGTVVDNTDTVYTSAIGTWSFSTSVSGYYGTNYQTRAAGTGNYKFNWMPVITTSGTYEVYARWTAGSNRADNAKYTVTNHTDSMLPVQVNQKLNNGVWVSLGKYSFITGGTAQVTLSNNANGYVIADAVKLVLTD